jgi:hypothetical protein
MPKLCIKCSQEKPIEEFGQDKNSPDGRRCECKLCRSVYEKRLYEASKSKYRARIDRWKDKHREEVRASGRRYYKDNKDVYREYKRNNPDEVRRWNKLGHEKFHKKYPHYQGEYGKKRRKTDFTFRIVGNLRSRLSQAIHGLTKSAKTKELIGCSVESLMAHLGKKFLPGMSWDNYGEWHIDHIVPCAVFDLSKSEEQRKCFHFSNLQPLWAEDNWRKNKKVA